MYNLGLKIWSTNHRYIDDALSLYERGVYQYIEMLTVPGSYEKYSHLWSATGIPFVLHAPHNAHGLNLSDSLNRKRNSEILSETFRYADLLGAKVIVIHAGIGNNNRETATQLKNINDKRLCLENQPYCGLIGDIVCSGHSVDQIRSILEQVGCNFCLDVGHATYFANYFNIDPYAVIEDMIGLNPVMYHVTDGESEGVKDAHLHLGCGTFDLKRIKLLLPLDAIISLETEKNSMYNLNDFEDDVLFWENI